MSLPPLFKYLNVEGAKLTLGNNTFRHAKPSDFNDTEDLTIQSLFPEEIELALKKLSDNINCVILAHLDDMPTCGASMREKLAIIQGTYRTNPKAAEFVKAELTKDGAMQMFDVEHMRSRTEDHIKEINDFMQTWRIFCVSTLKDSERMWTEYAEKHRGIALRIEPNVAKDSKFQLFKPVIYREKRPPFFDDTLEYLAGSLYGDQPARALDSMNKIIYSKTLKWKHESEYRLAIPLGKDEEPYNTVKYHPEEVTELYLGIAMDEKNKRDIIAKAKTLNPTIVVFQANRDLKGGIAFHLL